MEAKVSIIQFQPELGKPSANISVINSMISQSTGSSLVVLPELANSGYAFKDFDEAVLFSETIGRGGEFQDFLIGQAASRNIHIVSGINEKDGDFLYNSAILVGPSGIIGKYRKIHLFMNEKDIFQPGNAGLPVFDLGGFKIGIMICFDYLFPEPWRILAQKGADLVCHPSNLLTQNAHRCMPGLALMNRIYIATANRIGTERGIAFNGQSMFTEPTGKITAVATPDQPEILTVSINTELSQNKMVTARNHAFNDRLPDRYVP